MIGSGKHWRVTVEPRVSGLSGPVFAVRRREWNGWPLRSQWSDQGAAMAEADRLARLGRQS